MLLVGWVMLGRLWSEALPRPPLDRDLHVCHVVVSLSLSYVADSARADSHIVRPPWARVLDLSWICRD